MKTELKNSSYKIHDLCIANHYKVFGEKKNGTGSGSSKKLQFGSSIYVCVHVFVLIVLVETKVCERWAHLMT